MKTIINIVCHRCFFVVVVVIELKHLQLYVIIVEEAIKKSMSLLMSESCINSIIVIDSQLHETFEQNESAFKQISVHKFTQATS